MKRVSFEIAKTLKESGYPQTCDSKIFYWYKQDGTLCSYVTEVEPIIQEYHSNNGICIAPTYIDAWLWLWRKKKIKFSLEPNDDFAECYNSKDFGYLISKICDDPEEAIKQAIKYLAEHNLIK